MPTNPQLWLGVDGLGGVRLDADFCGRLTSLKVFQYQMGICSVLLRALSGHVFFPSHPHAGYCRYG